MIHFKHSIKPFKSHIINRFFSVASNYDVIVIGGGSGGIACARESAKLGAKVALFDYVVPSSRGTTWGLGGTCVNVGCIPKKLMHYSSLLKAQFSNAQSLGWETGKIEFRWEKMVETIQNHIKSLNFGYRVDMMKNKVNYINAFASFCGERSVNYRTQTGELKTATANNIIIAVGGRPVIPNIPNAKQLGITSDDIFSLAKSPGKTLIIGASYIALETAGFLTEMGYDTTVAVRSIALRNFDRQCAESIADFMAKCGTKFLRQTVPQRLDKEGAKIKVVFKNSSGNEFCDVFDTVLFATGRKASLESLNLEIAGVKTSESGKIIVSNEKTSNSRIYALGDAINAPELTPVAIQAGTLLARRLMGKSDEKMNYELVPTAVFTPLEYGCVGLSEEEAIKRHGKENLEIFVSSFSSVENAACHRLTKADEEFGNTSLAKLICLKPDLKVIGFHYLGENAGEITGGYALAIKLGATKKDFDATVGIHPTTSESFTTLKVTKSSGESYEASGC